MFYDAIKNDHELPHDPFQALIVPRPIGWISTLCSNGVVNLAPYSFFTAVGIDPHYVMFSSGGRKDTLKNAEETGEFVCSLANYALREQVKATGATVAPDVDEMEMVGLTKAPSRLVKPPRVAEAPAAFECRYQQTVNLPARDGADTYAMVIGVVVGVYINDEVLRDGIVDTDLLQPLARLGYKDYATLGKVFPL